MAGISSERGYTSSHRLIESSAELRTPSPSFSLKNLARNVQHSSCTLGPQFAIQLRNRTKTFALDVLRLVDHLPRRISTDAIARQIIRSAISVAANYRAAQRGRSKAEFIAKIGIVVEEADETVFWMEMLIESGTVSAEKLKTLQKEANELVAIFAASQRTARK